MTSGRFTSLPRSLALATGILMALVGCQENSESPTSPQEPAAPALAAAAAQPLSFQQVSAGFSHNCGLTLDGRAYCWGQNEAGQLGDGTTLQRLTPVAVAGGLRFRQVSAGARHTCAL